jgi:hypothetical protein
MICRFQPDLLIYQTLYAAELLFRKWLPRWMLHPRCMRVYEMPVPKLWGDETEAFSGGIEFRWATAEDTPLLEKRFGEKVILGRLSYGHRAAILVKDGALIGAAFFASRSFRDIDTDTRIILSFDENWLYGAWIHRKYRNRGNYSRFLRHAGVDLRHRGVRGLLFALDTLDVRSKRIHRRMGAKPIGRIYGVRLAKYNAYRYSRMPFTPRA